MAGQTLGARDSSYSGYDPEPPQGTVIKLHPLPHNMYLYNGERSPRSINSSCVYFSRTSSSVILARLLLIRERANSNPLDAHTPIAATAIDVP